MFVALIYERALNIEEESHVGGGLKANALLAAVAAGWMTAPSGYALHIQIAIAIAAASTAFVLTAAIPRMLENGQTPALLWGFCFTASGMFAMLPAATQLAAQRLTWWREPLVAPIDWVTAFLRSNGSLVSSPSVETGTVVIVAILLWSRTALAAGIIAWVAGGFVAGELTDLGVVYHWLPSSYNYFVAGMAIGAYFIVPAYSSLALGAMAGIVASLFEAALQSVMPGLAYLPAAASLTIWCSMATFAFARNRAELWRNRWPRVPPEMAWWRDASWSERFGRNEPLLAMPVDGAALVAQGFDGNLSHVKKFRHALDFTRAPESTASPENQTALEAAIWKPVSWRRRRAPSPACATACRTTSGA